MILVEKTEVFNFEGAIRGMRNPLNSWDRSDSVFAENPDDFVVGPNDMGLMQKLVKAGSEHRKFMRQIMVCVDITAPLYWWKEFDTYKVGTVANSCSTMHKIAAKEFKLDDFSHEHLFGSFEPIQKINSDNSNYYEVMFTNESIKIKSDTMMMCLIELLNFYREKYLETKDKKYWWQMIQLLPSSYNQRRTWTGNYENLFSMYHQRKNHKLDEWHQFCDWIETLPYANELIVGDSND